MTDRYGRAARADTSTSTPARDSAGGKGVTQRVRTPWPLQGVDERQVWLCAFAASVVSGGPAGAHVRADLAVDALRYHLASSQCSYLKDAEGDA